MTKEIIEKLIKLVAESDSLTQIGEKYINYMYFETAVTGLLLLTVLGGIIYGVYKIINYEMNN